MTSFFAFDRGVSCQLYRALLNNLRFRRFFAGDEHFVDQPIRFGFIGRHEKVTVRIPSHALLEGEQVLLVEDGRLVARDVEVGLSNWDYTEIVSGLRAGEEVVVSLDRPEVQPGASAVVEKSQGAP